MKHLTCDTQTPNQTSNQTLYWYDWYFTIGLPSLSNQTLYWYDWYFTIGLPSLTSGLVSECHMSGVSFLSIKVTSCFLLFFVLKNRSL